MPEELVGLQAQPPLRVRQAVRDGERGCCASRSGPSIGCRKKWSKSSASKRSGSAPACGKTSFSSSPAREHERRAGLGAHADPVDACRRPAACRWSRSRPRSRSRAARRRAAASSCSSGSPPVQTTSGRAAAGRSGHVPRDRAPRDRPPSRTCRRPGRRCRRSRCRRSRQTAVARSSSWPDHRLQPAKRQNTAGRPVFAPSPCSV